MEAEILVAEESLAERWNLSRSKLRNDRWAGRSIPFLRIGRSVRYRLRDIEAYENARRVVQGIDSAPTATDRMPEGSGHGQRPGARRRR
jgi:hypothetical protein